MAIVVTMPRLSDTMTEGVVASWLKKVGDKVVEGDMLAEIETDKATMEFESFNAGTLLHIGVQEGEGAPVDALLAIIGEEGEDISGLLNGGSKLLASKAESSPTPVVEEKSVAPAVALPTGVEIVTMPRLSDTMTEGTVASWIKKIGDTVSEGDILAEIETDKATMEFESFHSGTLLYIGVEEGKTAAVDAVLAILGPAGTDVSAFVNGAPKAAAVEVTATVNDVVKAPATPAATAPVQDSTTADGGRIFASPLAKKIAQEKGISLITVKGSGENGRIVKADIENYVPVVASAPVAQASVSTTPVKVFVPAGEEQTEEVKNSQMRKVIARRLAESKFTAPHYYLTIEIMMDNAMASRSTINSLPDTKVSFNDMVVKACAMALKQHPQVNSKWSDEAMYLHHHVNIGVAVAVPDGLVVPVVNHADQLSLSQIGTAVKDLAGKAKNKKLTPAEMEGSTFTISNLGMFGISEFTSIINQPNSAILSVGAIVQKPVVKNGAVVVGNTMKVTLACDHRTVDGATGAQFLQTLRQYIENPITMLA